MTEKTLITIADVRGYRELTLNYDQTRFDGYVNEIQRTHLRNLLKDKLWYDFFENITSEKYAKLKDGGFSYINSSGETAQYFGLKPFIIYKFLAQDAMEGAYFHTNIGVAGYNPETISRPSNAQRNDITKSYLQQAVYYSNNIKDYLNNNNSLYPLWDDRREDNITKYNFQII